MIHKTSQCWICQNPKLSLAKPSDITGDLDSNNFAITDSSYGQTGEIDRCDNCGFLQCTDLTEVLSYYETLKDEQYEEGRSERAHQAHTLLKKLKPYHGSGRLLDVGAGSGILVEEAVKLGYVAEGIEPSTWLQQQAHNHNLLVHLGTLPHPDVIPPFDVVTVVDVIEHVADPVGLLASVKTQMHDDGVGLVVTPNVGSLSARLMGWKWWHFRIAHIGYFNRNNLILALKQAGLEPVKIGYPSWYFSLDYLVERLNQYLPRPFKLPILSWFKVITVPLNLFDSLYVVFKKTKSHKSD